jgi:hypothetical protein
MKRNDDGRWRVAYPAPGNETEPATLLQRTSDIVDRLKAGEYPSFGRFQEDLQSRYIFVGTPVR